MADADRGQPADNPSRTVLVIHHDLGLILWLCHALAERGHVAVPATTVSEATRLIEELEISKVDLLVAGRDAIEKQDLVPILQSRQETMSVVTINDADLSGEKLPLGLLARVIQALQNQAGGAG